MATWPNPSLYLGGGTTRLFPKQTLIAIRRGSFCVCIYIYIPTASHTYFFLGGNLKTWFFLTLWKKPGFLIKTWFFIKPSNLSVFQTSTWRFVAPYIDYVGYLKEHVTTKPIKHLSKPSAEGWSWWMWYHYRYLNCSWWPDAICGTGLNLMGHKLNDKNNNAGL